MASGAASGSKGSGGAAAAAAGASPASAVKGRKRKQKQQVVEDGDDDSGDDWKAGSGDEVRCWGRWLLGAAAESRSAGRRCLCCLCCAAFCRSLPWIMQPAPVGGGHASLPTSHLPSPTSLATNLQAEADEDFAIDLVSSEDEGWEEEEGEGAKAASAKKGKQAKAGGAKKAPAKKKSPGEPAAKVRRLGAGSGPLGQRGQAGCGGNSAF